MSKLLKKAAEQAIRLSTAVLGRGQVARAARFLTNTVRLDPPNNMASNGENMVIECICRAHTASRPLLILDCGANVGHYAQIVLKTLRHLPRTPATLHCFEPCSSTFHRLRDQLLAEVCRCQVHCHQLALSDAPSETAIFRVSRPGAGTNSLLSSRTVRGASDESVVVATLDRFCELHGIAEIDLLKVDTEGNDFNVLLGGRSLFASRAIRVVQFEYNYRWIYARRFLRDAFELLMPFEYLLGKVTPQGVEFYSKWHPELEKFVEGNYLACRRETQSIFHKITWWGDQIRIPYPSQ